MKKPSKPHLQAVDTPAQPKWKALALEYWPHALVAAVAFFVYAHTIGADFLRWDDRQNILLNPWIENRVWSLIWTRPYYNMYIPVTYSYWTVLWSLTPNDPLLFHLSNVIFHAANAVLVYLIARVLLKPEEKLAAIFAGAIFAAHPLQVETVAWISTFRDILSAFFGLWGVHIVLTKKSKVQWAFATLLFCVCLLSKPSSAVIPAAMLFVLYGLKMLDKPKTLLFLLWFIPALAASYVTKRIQQLDADLRLPPMDLGRRILVAVDSLSFYVQKLFVPYPLAPDYGRTREVALDDNLWVIGLIAMAVIGATLWFLRKRVSARMLAFAGMFVLLLAPVLGIIPFQAQGTSTVADRYAYLPLIPAGLFFGVLLGRAKAWPAGAVIVAVLSVMTFVRAQAWATNEVFFRDMLAKNEKSHVALSSLGVEFILSGRLPEAEQVLNGAVKLRPKDVIPRTNLAQLYLLQNRPDRVVSEIAPLLDDPEFLHVNQTETRALASAYRLAGRAFWAMSIWSKGNDFFCRWFNLDYENEEGKAEVLRFLEDARRHGATLKNCEVKLRQ